MVYSHNIKLWVSLTPWRKRFVVIAGFPLSGPPRGNGRYYYCYYPPPLYKAKNEYVFVFRLLAFFILEPDYHYTKIFCS